MTPRDWTSNTEPQAARSARQDAHDHRDVDHDDGWFAGTVHDCEVPAPGTCLQCALAAVLQRNKGRVA